MRKASTPCVIMTGPPTNVRRKASLRLRMRSALDSVLLVMARSLYVWGKGWRSLVAGARGNKRDGPKAAPKRPWGLKPLPGLLARDAEFGRGDGNIFGPTLECRIFGRLKPFECELALVDPFDCCDPEPLEPTLLVPVGREHPRADPKRFPGIGRRDVGVFGLAGGCGCGSRRTRGSGRRALVRGLF